MPEKNSKPIAHITDDQNHNHVASDDTIQELLRPGKEFESKLHARIAQLGFGVTNLVLVNVKDYAHTSSTLLSYFQSKKIPGIYVTINKPYADVVKTHADLPDNIKFIDTITALTGKETEDTPNVSFLDSPLALVELNLAITEKLKGIVSTQKFLILDSVSTLLVYNSSQSVEKFCHTVIAKNRHESVIGLFIMIESEEHKDVVDTLAQFVDAVISLQ